MERWFNQDVDVVMNDDEALENIVKFLMRFSIYALPKEDSFRTVKDDQMLAYTEEKSKEIGNDFPSFIELLSQSDMSWTAWQYINSYQDWHNKKNKTCKKHELHSRFTGDSHNRCQPYDGSDGMKIYKKIHTWYGEFRKHDDYCTKARRMSNKVAKDWKILPTWTLEQGPKIVKKKSYASRPDPSEAPEIEFDEDDESVVSGSVENFH